MLQHLLNNSCVYVSHLSPDLSRTGVPLLSSLSSELRSDMNFPVSADDLFETPTTGQSSRTLRPQSNTAGRRLDKPGRILYHLWTQEPRRSRQTTATHHQSNPRNMRPRLNRKPPSLLEFVRLQQYANRILKGDEAHCLVPGFESQCYTEAVVARFKSGPVRKERAASRGVTANGKAAEDDEDALICTSSAEACGIHEGQRYGSS